MDMTFTTNTKQKMKLRNFFSYPTNEALLLLIAKHLFSSYQTQNQYFFLFLLPFRREFGLERFVPVSLIDGMKRKELRRLMAHFLKLNSQMTGSSKMLTQLQVNMLAEILFDFFFVL